MTYREPAPHPGIAFWVLALIPALSLAISHFAWWLLLPWVLLLLIKGVLPPILAALLVNLAMPLAHDRRRAILFAIPATFLHYCLYSFPPFWMALMSLVYPGDAPAMFGPTILTYTFTLPLEAAFLAMVASAAWIGARLHLSMLNRRLTTHWCRRGFRRRGIARLPANSEVIQ